MPFIDDAKIQSKINELNDGLPTPEWVRVNGSNAFVQFNITSDGKNKFSMDAGYPVQIFVNSRTNELKMFPVAIFISNR